MENMEMILVTRASSDYFFGFTTIEDVATLFTMYGSFVIEENFFYGENDILSIANGFKTSISKAELISKCRLNLIIYDDYIE